jgi:hypothetical protein
VPAASNFCSSCGRALGPAQRSTGQLRVISSVVLEGLAKLDDTAPTDLATEGDALEELSRRWEELGPAERRAAFDRAFAWSRAVGEWRTRT